MKNLNFLIILIYICFSQDCDENMLIFDCDGLPFCNNESNFGHDCYVNNEFCEDFNGDGVTTSWLGDGWCDDGTWGVDFQCEEYSFDCGDCGNDFSNTYGYCDGIPESYNFNHEGLERQYYLYIPELLEENAPLVFVLHGLGGSANQMIDFTGMNAVAEEYGFAVCYPQGTADQGGTNFWNVGYQMHQSQTVNDVAFLSSLANYLQDEYGFNSQKIFSTGFSNGGDMSYMLACQANDMFRAIAPVAGCMMERIYNSCDSTPVPVLEIHGDNDSVTLWAGDMQNNDGWGAYYSIEDGIEFWVETNDCQGNEEIFLPNSNLSDGSYIINHRYFDCSDNAEVWLYEIVGGGHHWPGSNGNMDINASEEIWNFFSQFAFILGDINSDDSINVLDIVSAVNFILSNEYNNSADLNADNTVNVLDVVQLINIILS